jgi:spermidine synthase
MPSYPELREGAVFLEPPELEGRLGLALKVDKVLWETRTRYQHLAVVEAGPLGRVLLLDGAIQLATAHEAAYHEMLAHLPLLTHPDPRRVLVIGGGDGGTLREVLRHPGVERCDLCEIDGEVIEASRRFLPELAGGFDDRRARVLVEDGVAFMRGQEAAYDVILVDSSDPEGPARGLFGREFYSDLRRALKPGGLAASQAESFAFYAPLLAEMFGFLAEMFPLSLYYQAQVPSYLGGSIGFALNSLGPDPLEGPDLARLAGLGPLRHYTASLHHAAFALPAAHLALLPKGAAGRQG